MVQECDNEEPCAVDEIGDAVVGDDGLNAVNRGAADEEGEHGAPAGDGEDDLSTLVLGEELGSRREMSRVLHLVAVPLDQVDRVAKGPEEECLRVDKAGERDDAFVLCLGHRVEDLVLLIVACVLMVLPMRDTPRMERDKNRRVENMSKERVDTPVLGKAPVPAVMPEHKHRPHEEAGEEPEEGEIERVPARAVREVGAVVERGEEEDVAQHVVHGRGEGGPEAVRGDDALDLGERWHVRVGRKVLVRKRRVAGELHRGDRRRACEEPVRRGELGDVRGRHCTGREGSRGE